MKTIVNKDNDLIKKYLNVRQELIEEFKKNFDTNFFTFDNPQKYLDNWLENIESEGKIDSLLYNYDDYVTSTKLSDKAKELLDCMLIVDYDYIAYNDDSYKPELMSFKIEDERKNWLENKKNNYYCVKINEIKGSLEDNYEDLFEKFNDGDALFIRTDSIYSDNIKIAILKYDDL